MGAMGGLVGNTPLICGGWTGNSMSAACYSLKEDGDWKSESNNLNTVRQAAANGYVIMKNKLVIAGGWNLTRMETIEVVAPNTKSETLPIKLPLGISDSCMVPWDTNTFLFIGGYNDGLRRQTYFINITNNSLTNGPSLLTGRNSFACHTININGEDYIIVAGGNGASRSMEYLQKANYASGWKKSKNWRMV